MRVTRISCSADEGCEPKVLHKLQLDFTNSEIKAVQNQSTMRLVKIGFMLKPLETRNAADGT